MTSSEVAFEVGRLFAPITAIAEKLIAQQQDIFIKLPGIVAYYPFSITNASGDGLNHAGDTNRLTQVGTVPLAFDGNAYRHTGAGINYFDGGAIYGLTGTETFITASLRGFTIGGWFMVDTLPAAAAGMMSKDKISPQRGYTLVWKNAGNPALVVSSNGAATSTVDALASTLASWHFVVGRFIPSTELAIFVDGDKTTNTTAIPAQCFVSSQAFEIGRTFNDNNQVLHMKARDVFICRTALSDAILENLRVASAPG